MIFLVLHRTNVGYIRLCTRFLVVALLILIYVPVFAAQVTFEPSLELSETYTDNVNRSKDLGEEDYITDVTPGFALQADGNRLSANLGFTVQNLFHVKDSSRNDQYHKLEADASAELISDFAFLNLEARDSKQKTSPLGGIAQDNLNTADTAEVSVWTINPHFKKRFGGKAEGSASYSYKQTQNDGLEVSNAETETVNIGLKSGPSLQRMTWSLDYSQKTIERSETGNNSEESSKAEAAYRVYEKLAVLFQAGDERSDLSTFQDGSYYALGISMIPSSTLQFDLYWGTRLESASVSWAPTRRSALNLVLQRKKTGLNPGQVLTGTLQLKGRRVTWRAEYSEDEASDEEQLENSLSGNSSSSECSLSGGSFERKRGEMDFGYKTVRSRVSTQLYEERREFGVENEKSSGSTVSWHWRLASRTTMLLDFHGSKEECFGNVLNSRNAEIGFSRKMGRAMEGHIKAQKKSGSGARDYDENRFSVGVKWRF